jgi:hypothetical protein
MRQGHRARRLSRPLLLWGGLFAILTTTGASAAAHPGMWTPKFDWAKDTTTDARTAIHMALLRGDDSPYHSRIMWFGGEPLNVFKGGIWGWDPNVDSCLTYPTTNFTAITPPSVGHNVFCSGHSGLADGRMFVAGGHSDTTGDFGVDDAATHNVGSGSGSGSWTVTSSMSERRWYPTNTTLKDGRVLVTAGFQHRQHHIFGGRLAGNAPVSPSGDSVRRWVPTEGGGWDPPVQPEDDLSSSPSRPSPREGHTGIDLSSINGFFDQTLIFGGRDTSGVAQNDIWVIKRAEMPTSADFSYSWDRKSPSGTAPSERSEHSMIVGNGAVIIFGGKSASGTPLSDIHRYVPGNDGSWAQVEVDAGTPPSGRMGHIAIYNEMQLTENYVDKFVRRMIVYGGVASENGTPTDNAVYEFRFDASLPTHGTWSVMPETTFSFAGHPGGLGLTAPPLPRYWHRAVAGAKSVTLAGGAPVADLAYVFGGAHGDGAYCDSLWMLCLFASGNYGWVYHDVGGPKPSPRARFSMAHDFHQGGPNEPRLYVHGGVDAGGLADPGVYTIDPFFFGSDWRKWGEAGYSATGHVSVCASGQSHSRVGEIFDPGTGNWTKLTGAPLLEYSYLVTFSVGGGNTAGGRVITMSSVDGVTRYTDLPGPGSSSSSWNELPNADLNHLPETGVVYRPDRVMIAGGAVGTTVVGTTLTLDASNTSNAWDTSATMLPRFYHNLVLLPDGKVLATGGASTTTNYNANSVKEPQIWDPAGSGGAGSWTAPNTLDASEAVRGYHSTSLLLPDGRVLCAGGWSEIPNTAHPDQLRADIYCPPYLFNEGGSFASRPQINSSPEVVTYSERFQVCLESDTVSIGSIALLRSGMTTHSFDQNQRYVPLTWTPGGSTPGVERTVLVDAPWNPSQAPPGDYLLFVVNGTGTPSIGQWIRLVTTSPDTDRPQRVLSLSKVCSHGESVDLKWNPPAEDSLAGACAGPVQAYELRYSTSALDTWGNFQAGTLAETPGVPGLPGSSNWDETTISGLTPNTRYYFRLISKDYAGASTNWSAMSNQATFITHYEECGSFLGGGGGGGGSLRSAGEASSIHGSVEGSAAAPTPTTGNSLLANVPGGVTRTDRLHLPEGPEWTGEGARVRLERTGTRGTHVESLRLLAVDHAAGSEVIARGEGLVVGTRSAALSVAHRDGRDLTDLLAQEGGYPGTEQDTVLVSVGEPGAGTLVLSSRGAQLVLPPSESGLEVQSRSGNDWVTVGRHHPRALGGHEAFDVPDRSAVRLVFRGEHQLLAVAGLAVAESPQATALEPVSLVHSASSTGFSTLPAEGLTLDPGESLLAAFEAQPAAEGGQRAWFLEVTGAHGAASTGSGTQSSAARPVAQASAPLEFALRQNRPNPLAASTTIAFEVPLRTHVELAVFDLLGRRIAVLADRVFEPGRHEAIWDRRDLHGRMARPGVYQYRLVSSSGRQQRTMVVIP